VSEPVRRGGARDASGRVEIGLPPECLREGRGSVDSGLFGSVARELACTSTMPVVVCSERAAAR
jgi:hypothetical protein